MPVELSVAKLKQVFVALRRGEQEQVKAEQVETIDLKELLEKMLREPDAFEHLRSLPPDKKEEFAEFLKLALNFEYEEGLRDALFYKLQDPMACFEPLLLSLSGKTIEVNGKLHAVVKMPEISKESIKYNQGGFVYDMSNEGYSKGLLSAISKFATGMDHAVGVLGGGAALQLLSEGKILENSPGLKIDLVDINLNQILFWLIELIKYNEAGTFPVLRDNGKGTKDLPIFSAYLEIHNEDIASFLKKRIKKKEKIFVYLSNIPIFHFVTGNSEGTVGSYVGAAEEILKAFKDNKNIAPGSIMLVVNPTAPTGAIIIEKEEKKRLKMYYVSPKGNIEEVQSYDFV